MTKLFNEIELSGGIADKDEPVFSFLERSSNVNAVSARKVLETWLELVPDREKDRFISGVRDENDTKHHASVFELFVHAHLISAGWTIIEYEPTFGGKNPDFLTLDPLGQEVIVEASEIQGETNRERRHGEHCYNVWRVMNEVPPTPFLLHIEIKEVFTKAPNLRIIRNKFRDWCSSKCWENPFEIEESGSTIRVAKLGNLSKKGKGPTIASMTTGEARGVYPEANLRKKLKTKSKQLEPTNLPSILALKLPIFHANEYTISQALFGDEQMHFDVHIGRIVNVTRQDNGALLHRGRADRTAISGILCVSDFAAWELDKINLEYWQHPWAHHPYDGRLLNTTRYVPDFESHRMVKENVG